MLRKLTFIHESWPISGSFTISRGSKTEAQVIVCTIEADGFQGRGECVPYRRYGETMDSVASAMTAAKSGIETGASRAELLNLMPPGAARNAVDCALWDLEAKIAGTSAAALMGLANPRPLLTAVTVSLGTPAEMAAATRAKNGHPLIKAKLGGEGDAERIAAVRAAAPDATLILDANEAWREADLPKFMAAAAEYGVALIEQPLPADEDAALSRIERLVPVCADESAHTAQGLDLLRERYDAVNIKLDKTGGLTAALAMKDRATALGFGIMAGCMVGTSLAMAPAVLLAQGVEWADLDGPLILLRDRPQGLQYRDGMVYPPDSGLWG
jgi:L-alanine-DL-glutamate epimerase-like enolase superfamily enzyme